ncbi:hypothetical protein HK098_001467 [Nowakowskiella sp. JEL0407]|nr:hypothetical protein HK098_001463 [Nowakowskiella sp. JEL0407]KAJ3123981.1 hypothetical protein HK098_001467 [Nowakowskiella sp. JEL0407]
MASRRCGGGVFWFAVKLGVAVWTIDWVYRKYQENHTYGSILPANHSEIFERISKRSKQSQISVDSSDPNQYLYSVDVPGIPKTNLEVAINEDTRQLIINGKANKRAIDIKVSVPENASVEKIASAVVEDGVLKLAVPKGNSKEKVIPISLN